MGGIARLAKQRLDANLVHIRLNVERHLGDLGAILGGKRRDRVVEAIDQNMPVGTQSCSESRIATSAWIGFCTVPPYMPECRSLFAPATSICTPQPPRRPTRMFGSVSLHWPPSELSARSHFSRSRWAATKSAICGLPISSWPSKKNLTLTGSAPSLFSSASVARIGVNILPLSSDAPRAYTRPSRTTGSNGGLLQRSSGSAGWVSKWP